MKRLLVLCLFVLVLAGCGQAVDGGIVLRSADPSFGIFVPVAPAPPLPTVAPDVKPFEPVPCLIKGNISASGEKIAHSPGQANYETTEIDEAKGEKCFDTLEQAEAEGWRPAQR